MNELEIEGNKNIKDMIYEIRGKQVMLDSDLAELYKCKNGTKTINLAVKRHIDRFPERFMFQITKEEYNNLKFQTETSSWNNHGGIRKLPYAFTEQGVAMLSAVLRTEVAEIVSIRIMDAFVAMRHYIGNNLLEQKYINNLVLSHEEKINLLEDTLSKFEEKQVTSDIFFGGQIFDAYNKIFEIFKLCKNELIIIDSYADNVVLDIIKRLDVKVIIITKKDNLLTNQDITRYNKQYHNIKVIFNDTFHDRYFILDNDIVYHCGASINRIGYKTFSVTKIGDTEVVKRFLSLVFSILTNK